MGTNVEQNSDDPNEHVGGLEFPRDDAPDYLDFAYFAFVIGMTCQVSDVAISSTIWHRAQLVSLGGTTMTSQECSLTSSL